MSMTRMFRNVLRATVLTGVAMFFGAMAPSVAAPKHPSVPQKTHVALLVSFPDDIDTQRERLLDVALRGLRAHRLSPTTIDVSLGELHKDWPSPGACTTSECQAELCQKKQLRQLVSIESRNAGEDRVLRARIYDAPMAAVAAEVEQVCPRCDAAQVSVRLSSVLSELFKKALSRQTGLLEVTSMPPGATVRLNGMRVGQTPVILTTFAGEHRIEVLKPGFLPYPLDIEVEAQRGAAHDALLVLDPTAPQNEAGGLPRRAALQNPPPSSLFFTHTVKETSETFQLYKLD